MSEYDLSKHELAQRILDHYGVGDRAVSASKPFIRPDLELLLEEFRPDLDPKEYTTTELRHLICKAAVDDYDGTFAGMTTKTYALRIHEVRAIYQKVVLER